MKQREYVASEEVWDDEVTYANGRAFLSAAQCEAKGWSVSRDGYPWYAYKGEKAKPTTSFAILTDAEYKLWNAIAADNMLLVQLWKLDQFRLGFEEYRKAHKDISIKLRDTAAQVKLAASELLTAPFGEKAYIGVGRMSDDHGGGIVEFGTGMGRRAKHRASQIPKKKAPTADDSSAA